MNKIKISEEELKKNGFKLHSANDEDVIIKNDGYFDNEYVYDIEVNDGSHTFIADGILAHNSCAKLTGVKINNSEDSTFEDLFDELAEDMPIFKLENGKEMIDVEGWYRWKGEENPLKTNNQFGLSNIKNVVRHKVTKDKWKISIDNDSVEVTKDHSIMVYRDGYVIECKPEEIKKSDYLIKRKH